MSESGLHRRVLVALSGGVDSAVAAVLLVEQGVEVAGVMLRLWVERGGDGAKANRCCVPEAVDRARSVADHLKIPFDLIDAEALFESQVVDSFVAEYAAGRTPNPCVLCNRTVRFGLLLEHALARGATWVATGHYARVRCTGEGYQLLRGRDPVKDQSYFLHALSQQQLSRVLFPLGNLTKEQVRDVAQRRGLPVAEQPESQDICFLVDGDHRGFLARWRPDLFQPGPIRDTSGRVLGQHRGLPGYTIGQRKGLGIAAQEPLYVLELVPAENALVVGTVEELKRDVCVISELRLVSGLLPSSAFRAVAQIRYRAEPVGVVVNPVMHDRARVRFDSPQLGVTPGQSLVLYDGEVVLGGGCICSVQ